MSVISYPQLISPLKVLHQVLNSHSFGYITGSNQWLYPLYHVSLRTSVSEFLGIINLISSATIFYQSSYCNFCCYYCFSVALLIIGSHIVLISMLGQLRRFLWPCIIFYKFKLGHNIMEATKTHLFGESWRHSWSQYNDQRVQEILLGLQET